MNHSYYSSMLDTAGKIYATALTTGFVVSAMCSAKTDTVLALSYLALAAFSGAVAYHLIRTPDERLNNRQ